MSEPPRILLADDEETFLHSTADLLRKEGFECDCVANAEEAVATLGTRSYDLLIADIRMPGNPNLELIRSLQGSGGNLPIIVVTGYPSLQTALEAIHLPVVAYLVKPFEFEALKAEVDKCVSWSRLSRAVGSARVRLDHWKSELSCVEGVLASDSADARSRSIEAFLGVTLRNIAGSLADLERIANVAFGRSVAPEACQLLNCPRHARLVQALEETIAILERTKSSFKSRELGDLRQALEAVLEGQRKR